MVYNLKLRTPNPSYAAQPKLGDVNTDEESMLSSQVRQTVATFNGLVVCELSGLGLIREKTVEAIKWRCSLNGPSSS